MIAFYCSMEGSFPHLSVMRMCVGVRGDWSLTSQTQEVHKCRRLTLLKSLRWLLISNIYIWGDICQYTHHTTEYKLPIHWTINKSYNYIIIPPCWMEGVTHSYALLRRCPASSAVTKRCASGWKFNLWLPHTKHCYTVGWALLQMSF